ncbi:hypothetical protein TREPR_3398 [Treponema primitia ZAS-2]|uniref:Lipoprotein n=1 Tax=Treponema primitia (strain ATCC BAA-887 / DSM 12427 / ZAS-2) TaxID=545694 RepID=F5YJL6_TREPZ|nr:hypothetical protein [Treponema primitia]AEF85185.1 hypothetical protein TREPR_3398 [Treponema primitia ZAS-2]
MRKRIFLLYFAVLLTLTQCGNPLNAAFERELPPLAASNPEIQDPLQSVPSGFMDENYNARILVTNLITSQNITGIYTAKTTYPSPVLETGKPIKPGHEKSAWVEFDSNDVSFTFDFEDIADPFITGSETFERALQLYKDGFTRIYLYRTTGGAISVSPDPSPDDKSTDTPLPAHDPVIDSYIDVYNLTKLVPINTVTFDKTTDPESLGPIQPGTEEIVSAKNGVINLTIDYGDSNKLTKSIVALSGAVTNVYFYRAKDGTFKAEDAKPGDDKLFDEIPSELLGEGDISNDNSPQKILPDNRRDQLGILIVKNVTRLKNINSVSFTKGDKTIDMTPGPLAGSEKSIILEPGDWGIDITYTDDSKSITKTIVKAGVANFVNYLYFYKPLDGEYALSSDDLGPEYEVPPKVIDPDDWQNNPPPSSDVFTGEGQISNEDGTIAVPDTYKNEYGVVQIHNLTALRNITSVTFEKDGKKYPSIPAAITHGHSKSIVLGVGKWLVNIVYDKGSIDEFEKTVSPYGFTQYINHIYFYKNFDTPPGYNVKYDDDRPEDGTVNNTDDTGSIPEKSNLEKGLLVIYNDSDVAINVSHANISSTAIASKAHKEFWLDPAAYKILATYSGTGSPKDGYVTVLPNTVNYLYFKGAEPNYSFNTIVTPDVDTASGSSDPAKGTLIFRNAGPVNDLTKLQIKNQGPSGTVITTGAVSVSGNTEQRLDPGFYTITPYIKTGSSERESLAVFTNVQIIEGLTKTIVYEDSLEYDSPPQAGVTGDLWVQNKSQYQIHEIAILDPITKVEIIRKQVVIQPNNSEHLTVPYGSYLARVYTNERGISYIEASIKLDSSNRMFTLVIDDGSEKVISGGSSGGSGIDADKSGLRIYNSYSGPLPFKIFEVFLYEGTVSDGTVGYSASPVAGPGASTTGTPSYGGKTGSPATSPGVVWDLTKDAYLAKGQFAEYKTLKKDTYYRVVVVAGSASYSSYPIEYNTSTVVTRDDISYFVGDFWLSAGALKTVRFDPYMVAKNDPDAPLGTVTIRLSHGASASGLSGNITRVQFIDGENEDGLQSSIARKDIVLSYEIIIEPTKEIKIELLPRAYRIRLDDVLVPGWSSYGSGISNRNNAGLTNISGAGGSPLPSFVPSKADGKFPAVLHATILGNWIYFDTSHHANQDFFMVWLYPDIKIKTDDITLPAEDITKLDLSGVIPDPKDNVSPWNVAAYTHPVVTWASDPEQYSIEMYKPPLSAATMLSAIPDSWQYNSGSWDDVEDSLNGGENMLSVDPINGYFHTQLGPLMANNKKAYQVQLKVIPAPGYSLPSGATWAFTPSAGSDYSGKSVDILYFPLTGVIKIRWPKL